jgi:hypothetical protein
MGRRWSDVPWVVERRLPDRAPELLARVADRDHAAYLARIVSRVIEGDVTLRDAGDVKRDLVAARFRDGQPARAITPGAFEEATR